MAQVITLKRFRELLALFPDAEGRRVA